MRVICIDDNWRPSKSERGKPAPCTGEQCKVIDSAIINKRLFYRLEGFPLDSGYEAKNFAPISDIDETTFERNYIKELV